jgi:hypothetical protein
MATPPTGERSAGERHGSRVPVDERVASEIGNGDRSDHDPDAGTDPRLYHDDL